jgi:hypothetical protein
MKSSWIWQGLAILAGVCMSFLQAPGAETQDPETRWDDYFALACLP